MATGYKSFTAGAVLAAADVKDYLMLQSVMTFASTAARDSALSAVLREGLVCYVTGTDRVYAYDGSTWIIIGSSSATGRVGAQLVRTASQSIPNTTTTPIQWDTETYDTDAFIGVTSPTITIPSGLGGVYSISAVIGLTSVTTGTVSIAVTGQTYGFDFVAGASDTFPSASIIVPLAATNTIQISLYQALGSAQNVTARASVHRLGA